MIKKLDHFSGKSRNNQQIENSYTTFQTHPKKISNLYQFMEILFGCCINLCGIVMNYYEFSNPIASLYPSTKSYKEKKITKAVQPECFNKKNNNNNKFIFQ